MRIGPAKAYCRLCGLEKPLVEAHIIARCIMKHLKSPEGPIRVISRDLTEYPRRIPTGVYDQKLLCASCDGLFSRYEEYIAETLYIRAEEARSAGCEGYFSVQEYDYSKIKLGLLSILWRMSITERPEFASVRIGADWEKIIRIMLWRRDPGQPARLAIGLLHLTDYIGNRSALGTGFNQYQNSMMWNIGLPGFIAVVKLGPDKDDHVFPFLVIKPNAPLLLACKDNKMEARWKDVVAAIRSRSEAKRST